MNEEEFRPLVLRLEALGQPPPPEAIDKLALYRDLLAASNERYSLISPHDVGRIVTRHFVECAGFLRWVPDGALRVLDFGSGGGLPGIVLAIFRAAAAVTLLESRDRKRVFLRQAIRTLEIRNAAVSERVGEAPPAFGPPFERIVVRGVGPLVDVAPEASAHLAPGGLLIVTKGSRAAEEFEAVERKLSSRRLEWIEHRIDPLTTKDQERIGGATLVLRRVPEKR